MGIFIFIVHNTYICTYIAYRPTILYWHRCTVYWVHSRWTYWTLMHIKFKLLWLCSPCTAVHVGIGRYSILLNCTWPLLLISHITLRSIDGSCHGQPVLVCWAYLPYIPSLFCLNKYWIWKSLHVLSVFAIPGCELLYLDLLAAHTYIINVYISCGSYEMKHVRPFGCRYALCTHWAVVWLVKELWLFCSSSSVTRGILERRRRMVKVGGLCVHILSPFCSS